MIELLVVIAILGLLVALLFPVLSKGREAGKRAAVVRLPPATRIERGAVEGDCPIADVDHHGVERGEIGVMEVHQFGGHDRRVLHRRPATTAVWSV